MMPQDPRGPERGDPAGPALVQHDDPLEPAFVEMVGDEQSDHARPDDHDIDAAWAAGWSRPQTALVPSLHGNTHLLPIDRSTSKRPQAGAESQILTNEHTR